MRGRDPHSVRGKIICAIGQKEGVQGKATQGQTEGIKRRGKQGGGKYTGRELPRVAKEARRKRNLPLTIKKYSGFSGEKPGSYNRRGGGQMGKEISFKEETTKKLPGERPGEKRENTMT